MGAEHASDNAEAVLRRMGGAIRHRGPDSAGTWQDPDAGIGFAHARLAIVDLSPMGAQPMASASGRFVIAYNGEIYNHLDLRRELEGLGAAPTWRGHSDTETLLAGFEAWGIAATLQRTIGMFAIALWDRRDRTLTLARDRLGEKPLYYGWQRKDGEAAFLFASELKALAQHPSFAGKVDNDALTLFMRYGYIPAPKSIYRDLFKLPPGSILVLGQGRGDPHIESYWSAADAIRSGLEAPLEISEAEAVDRLESLLADAVQGQLMSDVPLGAFLSGGVDSSLIVSLMQAHSTQPVKTFTVGFEEAGFNEAEHAKAVARHLGTDHTEFYLSAKDALDVVPRLPALYDEPFADSSQIPTFLVCQMARKHVTVALSGDGGDELFGGYGRYFTADSFWRRTGKLPRPLRLAARGALKAVPAGAWNRLGRLAGFGDGEANGFSTVGQLVHKAADLLGSTSPVGTYVDQCSVWLNPETVVLQGRQTPTALTHDQIDVPGNPIGSMMAIDLQAYLTDDILVKVDRAAMGVSLETRVPLLDHRVVEFAWQLPARLKFAGGSRKQVMRQVLYRHVPRELIDRPKQGFSVPLHHWLRGPLKDWASELLQPSRIRQQGFLNADEVTSAWKAHQGGAVNLHFPLWNVLMFQAWLETAKPEG